jgi:hypothetical protein
MLNIPLLYIFSWCLVTAEDSRAASLIGSPAIRDRPKTEASGETAPSARSVQNGFLRCEAHHSSHPNSNPVVELPGLGIARVTLNYYREHCPEACI